MRLPYQLLCHLAALLLLPPNNNVQAHRRCDMEELPPAEITDSKQRMTQWITNRNNKHMAGSESTSTIITIPTVWHILTDGTSTTGAYTSTKISSFLTLLNNAFTPIHTHNHHHLRQSRMNQYQPRSIRSHEASSKTVKHVEMKHVPVGVFGGRAAAGPISEQFQKHTIDALAHLQTSKVASR